MRFEDLNGRLRAASDEEIIIEHDLVQRYIRDGVSGKRIVIEGIPGSAMRGGAIYIKGDTGFCAVGMHGGRIYLRTGHTPEGLSVRVLCRPAGHAELESIRPALETFSDQFGVTISEILSAPFPLFQPDSKNPYKQPYTAN